MGLKDFYNYLRGDIRIELDGMSPESVLNKLSLRGTELWHIEHISESRLRVSMSAKDYVNLRPTMRKSGCRVKLISRRGILYTARHVRKRYAILAGIALLAAAAFYMNSVILTIEVTGCETIDPQEVIAAMERAGVGQFTRTKTVDASDLRNEILLDMPELIWFTVNFKGSRALVDVRERTDQPEVIDMDGAADIYADADGVITKMQVYYGEAAVEKGKAVYEGDLLVSGTVPLRTEGRTMEVHALADIWARVWNSDTAVTPAEFEAKAPTGRRRVRFSLIFGKKRVDFYKSSRKIFDNCDKITKRYILGSRMGIALPVTLEIRYFYEYEVFEKALDTDSAGVQLAASVREKVLQNPDTAILSQKVWTENGWLMARVNSETEKKIGKTVLRDE